jgi:hypothetical protein
MRVREWLLAYFVRQLVFRFVIGVGLTTFLLYRLTGSTWVLSFPVYVLPIYWVFGWWWIGRSYDPDDLDHPYPSKLLTRVFDLGFATIFAGGGTVLMSGLLGVEAFRPLFLTVYFAAAVLVLLSIAIIAPRQMRLEKLLPPVGPFFRFWQFLAVGAWLTVLVDGTFFGGHDEIFSAAFMVFGVATLMLMFLQWLRKRRLKRSIQD